VAAAAQWLRAPVCHPVARIGHRANREVGHTRGPPDLAPGARVRQDAEVGGMGTEQAWTPISAETRLRLLVEASSHLTDTLDLRAVARGLARSIVPTLADRVHVDLVESLFHPERGAVPDSTVLFRGASVAVDDREAPLRRDEWVAYPPGSAAAQALSAGITRGEADGDGGPSRLFVPLRARGRVLGVVGLCREAGGPPYASADVALAEEIASRAGLALDNVRLYDEARATAVALQRSLLPSVQPRVTGVDTAHRYLPGRRDLGVGGDWFDVIALSCGRVAFVIGDVMGRGLRAAAAMGQLRTAVRMLAVLDPMPEDVLRHLDDLAQNTDEVQLATCVYAVFDPVLRSLCFATAGHPPPVLQGPDGSIELLPQPSGAPLGVGGVPFESVTVSIADGSRLVLYTDGLVESRDVDIDEGLRRLTVAIADGPAGIDPLCDHVLVALGRDEGHDDDVALLVAELAGLDARRVATWRLDGGGEGVSAARTWVHETITAWDVEPLAELAQLLVSELVTNALRHARGPIDLTVLLLDEIVTLAVSDADQPLPRLRRVSSSDEGGRGLQLVAMLASRWGARPTVDGKVVWCDLPLPRR
jgi:serine phosphatase RsbU (regulator of sigma subunit)/anti-sigma regulatory factor (Ser/Thr protein kinase)